MAIFPAEFSNKAGKYIKKLDEIIKDRIRERINKLEDDPFPKEVERVEDYKGEKIFRVRVGDQRILYIVRHNPNKLLVVRVDKRSRAYQ
jgi:mRNA-degrading endonuclease RelE of RelBE toxin-antitoxin system